MIWDTGGRGWRPLPAHTHGRRCYTRPSTAPDGCPRRRARPPPQVISSKITSPASAVRHQAASVLAALALAAPPLMAKLLGSYLEAVEAGAQTLQMLAAPYSKPGVVGDCSLVPGEDSGFGGLSTAKAVLGTE
jgi:hypothetical protein